MVEDWNLLATINIMVWGTLFIFVFKFTYFRIETLCVVIGGNQRSTMTGARYPLGTQLRFKGFISIQKSVDA